MRCPIREQCAIYDKNDLKCEYGYKICRLYLSQLGSYSEARMIKWAFTSVRPTESKLKEICAK
jgi:hypothetical protein